MELPDNNAWIDIPDQDVVQQHALYAADLPPLSQTQEQSAFYGHAFHPGLSFEDASALQQHTVDFQQLQPQQFPQAPVEQSCPRASADAGDAAAVKRVNKADREKLRRDKLNEQFSELASALDPDRPKNDKATILSDSVQELNELRAEVKRLKTEQTALLDESRDLTQEKSELREEKALLKSETDQLNAQLQQRLRLALSWTMDPSLMMGAAYPYPVPVPTPTLPTPPPPAAAPASSASSTCSSSPAPTSTSTAQASCIVPPVMPSSPFAMIPPFAMHPYAMFANRPPSAGGNLPFFPYFPPPPGMLGSNPERPFPQYPAHLLRGYAPDGSQPPAPFLAGEAPYKPLVSIPAATKPRDEASEQPGESQQQTDSEDSPVESSAPSAAVEVKQEVSTQPFVKTLSPIREGSGSPSIRPAAA